MRPHDLKSGKCEGCGDWTGHGVRKLCLECRKPKVVMIECGDPDCKALFRRSGKTRYCLLHRVRKGSVRQTGTPPPPPGAVDPVGRPV